jgi:hypothetical protein
VLGSFHSSVFDQDPHDGPGAHPQPLGDDVEAALVAALKRSAVFDREPQTVEVMMELMAVTNAKIAKVRAEQPELVCFI